MPAVNWLLAAGTIGAVIAFGSSDALGGAVSMLMMITTVLAALVALKWGYNPVAVVAVNGFFLIIDVIFFAANSAKLLQGGWFPLLLAGVVAFMMITWRKGVAILATLHAELRQSEETFSAKLRESPPVRAPGAAAVFGAPKDMPLALLHHLRLTHALQQRVLIISTTTADAPQIAPERRAQVFALELGFTRILLSFGFMDKPDVPRAMRLACKDPALHDIDPEKLTWLLRREMVVPAQRPAGMARWRKGLFAAMLLNANRTASYYCLPLTRVIEVGMEEEIQPELRLERIQGLGIDLSDVTYHVGRASITGLPRWLEGLHAFLERNSNHAADALRGLLPV